MAIVGNLTVLVQAQTEDFARGMRKVKVELETTSRSVQTTQTAFAGFGRSLLGLAAGVASLAALRAGLDSIVRTGLDFQRLGASFTALTGSTEKARQEFGFVRTTANNLGIDIQALTQHYRSLIAATRGTAVEGEETRRLFTAVSRAAGVFGLSTEQVGRAFQALQQILSKGKVTQEELRGQLGEAIPGATQIAARGYGVVVEKLNDMVTAGLDAADFTRKFTAQLEREVPANGKVAGQAFAQLRNELAELKNELSGGIIPLLERAASGIAASLRRGREARDQAQERVRSQISASGVDPDLPRQDLVQALASVNTQLEQARQRVRQYEGSTRRTAVVAAPLARERLLVQALEAERQGLIADLSELSDEEAFKKASAAYGAGVATARLQAETALKEQNDALDQVRRRANEGLFADEQERLAEQAKTEEQLAQQRLGYLTNIQGQQDQFVESLQAELDTLTLTREELQKKAAIEIGLGEDQRVQQLLTELTIVQQIRVALEEEAQAQADVAREAEKTADAYARIVDRAGREQQLQLLEDQKALLQTAGNAADIVTQSLVDMAATGKASLQSLQETFTRFVLQALSEALGLKQALTGLFQTALGTSPQGATGGGLVGLLGGLFSTGGGSLPEGFIAPAIQGSGLTPGLASGGFTLPGRAYMVGERGPELFVPGERGTVYPHGRGPGGAVVNVYVTTPDAGSFRATERQVGRRAAAALAQSMRGA